MKLYFKFIRVFLSLYILIFLDGYVNSATVSPGKSIVPNECSSLGENNPLRLIDCSIFKLEKGMCCLLTITKTSKDFEDGVISTEEYFHTACIVLQKINADVINATTLEYKAYGDDVLIECSQNYIKKLFIYVGAIFSILLI